MFKKTRRIKSQKTIDKIKKIGYCEICGSLSFLQVHHIKSKGSGGHDTEDNLICLCYVCHTKTHNGQITREELKERIGKRDT